MSQYYKNFILCGEIDFVCILCEEVFYYVHDVDKHIRWQKHRELVKKQEYLAKFKRERIYKLKHCYYCEICNCSMLPNNESHEIVTTHVKESKHKSNKENPGKVSKTDLVKRDANTIFISKHTISKEQWNGIVDNFCIVCNVRINNVDFHITMTNHIIKLLQTEFIYENDYKYYRKINEKIFYCFICKKIFSIEILANHWADKEHNSNIIKSENEKINKEARSSQEPVKSETDTVSDKRTVVMKKLLESQKDYFYIDLEKDNATCKKCDYKLSVNFKAMVDHKKSHDSEVEPDKQGKLDVKEISTDKERSRQPITLKNLRPTVFQVVDHGKRRAELSKFGRANYVKLNPGGRRGYCSLCLCYVSPHMNNFQGHVEGMRHSGLAKLKQNQESDEEPENPGYKTIPLRHYLKNIIISHSFNGIGLNMDISVDIISFGLIETVENTFYLNKRRCFCCDVEYELGPGRDQAHFESVEHKRNFLIAEVVVLKKEFIRKLRPHLFHCGSCNALFPYWKGLESHINSSKHKRMRDDKLSLTRLFKTIYKGVPLETSIYDDILYAQLLGIQIWP